MVEQVEFKNFRIGELFDVLRTLKPGIKLKTQKFQDEEYNLPATSSTETNNSIGFYVRGEDHIEAKDVLSVTSNGAAGFICYHPEKIAVAQDSYLIKSKEELENSRSFYLYVSAILSKQTRSKFSYTNKCTWSKLANLKIPLPVDSSGSINYSYMESCISHIEKLHISRIKKLLQELGYNSLKDVELTQEDKEILRLFSGGEKLTLAEFKIGELFESHKIRGVNTDSLTPGNDYPYITRTSLNNGILGYSGIIKNANINESNSFSVGLLQMDFFLQEKQWYAGQFVRKILPKNEMSKKVLTYFLVHFNKMNKELSSVLVRDFDSKFLNKKIPLPINPQSPTIPNYSLMESYITAIEKLHVNKLISSNTKEIAALNTII